MRETWRSEMLRAVDMEGVDSPRRMALAAAARVSELRGKGMVAMEVTTERILRRASIEGL